MPTKCPKCGSEHTEVEGDDELGFLICLDCGYDEGEQYETPGERKSKGGKSSPYKRGGSLRTQKK
jgi:transcription initiation factor TFIIIB Brf1 subunit/transcription initiation factor TFIIB